LEIDLKEIYQAGRKLSATKELVVYNKTSGHFSMK